MDASDSPDYGDVVRRRVAANIPKMAEGNSPGQVRQYFVDAMAEIETAVMQQGERVAKMERLMERVVIRLESLDTIEGIMDNKFDEVNFNLNTVSTGAQETRNLAMQLNDFLCPAGQ